MAWEAADSVERTLVAAVVGSMAAVAGATDKLPVKF
jgi:hypothetical protein